MERKINYRKRNKGITLVALVVTIIVLLILAGVSLNLVAGSNGIMNRATKAVDVTNMAKIKEDIELKIAEMQMDYYSDSSLRNQYANVNEYIKAELEKGVELPNGVVITSDSSGNLNYDGVQIGTLNPDGSVSIDGELSGSQIVTKYTVSYNANGGQGGPSSARYENGETVTVDFTNIPTQTGCTFLGWARSANATTPEFTNSGSFTVSGNTVLYAVWEYGQAWHAAHPEKHIPTGFAHTEGTVDTGYVIKDSEGNEFVWIPVANDEVYAKKLGTNNAHLKVGSTGTDTLEELGHIGNAVRGDKLGVTNILGTTIEDTITAQQPEYAVVKKAGGFWIGRYEAGVESLERGVNNWIGNVEMYSFDASSEVKAYWNSRNITVKLGNEPVRVITQNKALERANNWKSGAANVVAGTVAFQSGLITGSQWDAMCKFIGWELTDIDASSWGNCSNVKSKIYSSLMHSTSARTDWFTENGTIQKGTNDNMWVFPTGVFETESGENTAKKNIYDIAGNVYEWTTEVPQSNESRSVNRGGTVVRTTDIRTANSREGRLSSTTYVEATIGFRIVLYVE